MTQNLDSVEIHLDDPGGGPRVREQSDLSGKYITFQLAEEVYGLEILKVREIIGLMDVTRVPRSEDYIRGVINLRGKVIPVMDLRRKFGMAIAEATDQSVIIVVQFAVTGSNDFTMGILVDEVLEVLPIDKKQIEPPPDFGTGGLYVDFLLGVGKLGQNVVFLLDIARVLSAGDVSVLRKSITATKEATAVS